MAQTLKRTTITRYLSVILAILVIIDTIPTVAYNRPPRPELSQHSIRPGTSRKPCRVKRLPGVTPGKILDPHFPVLLPLLLPSGRKDIGPRLESLLSELV